MTVAVIKYRPPTGTHGAHRETSFSQDHLNPHIIFMNITNYPTVMVYIPTLNKLCIIMTITEQCIGHLQAATRNTGK